MLRKKKKKQKVLLSLDKDIFKKLSRIEFLRRYIKIPLEIKILMKFYSYY